MTQITVLPEAAPAPASVAPGDATITVDPSTLRPKVTTTAGTIDLQGPTGATGSTGATGPQPPLSSAAPAQIGTAAPGVSTTASRDDHVHAHGNQAGGTLHAVATSTVAGFQAAADKARQDNLFLYMVNVADFGADLTGATASDTALTNAIGSGGKVVVVPGGTLLLNGAPYVCSANNVDLTGAGANATTIKTNATTGDQLRFTGYGSTVRNLTVQGPGSGTTSSKTSGIGLDMQSTEGEVENVNFSYQYDCLAINGTLVDADRVFCRYFTHNGINVSQNSDHRLSRVTMDNNAATLPTGGGIVVSVTASLILDRLNIIHSNVALDLSPAAGVTVPSVKATNCFFDTSAIGLRMAGAGSVFRSQFTNVWFSSMSTAGVQIGPTTAGSNADGITFSNCDIYNNVAGTTSGVQFTTGNYGSVDLIGCRMAGWTTGVSLAAGSTSAFPTFKDCHIGAVSAFGVNTTGVNVAAGTYAGLILDGNKVPAAGNTTVLTLGAVTVAVPGQFRITDNAGINPRGAVTTPAVPATTVTATNTTGFRVTVYVKGGVTSVVTVNGVATPTVLAAGGNLPVQLDPGGTIAMTFTTAPTWVWVAN